MQQDAGDLLVVCGGPHGVLLCSLSARDTSRLNKLMKKAGWSLAAARRHLRKKWRGRHYTNCPSSRTTRTTISTTSLVSIFMDHQDHHLHYTQVRRYLFQEAETAVLSEGIIRRSSLLRAFITLRHSSSHVTSGDVSLDSMELD